MKVADYQVGQLPRILEILQRVYPHGRQQFELNDAISLAMLITKVETDRPMILEVGSWEGLSTAILANQVKDNNGKVFAVDHWRGSEDTWSFSMAQGEDVFEIFKFNMKRIGLWDTVHPMVMDSETAASIFAEGILDLVFIDADHRYKYIKQDIINWLPMLKVGGYLCGHDAEFYYSRLSKTQQNQIDAKLDEDCFRLGNNATTEIHPGVVKALYECLGDKHLLMPRRIWYYIKKQVL